MLRFADSFDHYGGNIAFLDDGLWSGLTAASGGSISLSDSFARTGDYSLHLHRSNFSEGLVEGRFPIGAASFTWCFNAELADKRHNCRNSIP
jgi:hypothetical protein